MSIERAAFGPLDDQWLVFGHLRERVPDDLAVPGGRRSSFVGVACHYQWDSQLTIVADSRRQFASVDRGVSLHDRQFEQSAGAEEGDRVCIGGWSP